MIPPLSTRAGHDAAVRQLTSINQQLAGVQREISTGRRVLKPGDDAIAFSRAAALKRVDQVAETQRRSMLAASARLSASETALAGIADITLRAKELALAGRNETLSASDRAILALEVRELAAAARGLAESRSADGEALFAGAAPPPSYADDAQGLAAWAGLGTPPEVATTGRRLAQGISGPDAFGVTAPLPPPDPMAPPPDPDAPPAPRERNLFDSLTHLEAMLTQARPEWFTAGMDEAIGALDGHINRLSGAQAVIGARAARLEGEERRLDTNQLAVKSAISDLQDTDIAEAAARLSRLSVVLEAAQASFARVSRLSLWDDLR
jgi:flagellar hook-associated protein 3 FlgL